MEITHLVICQNVLNIRGQKTPFNFAVVLFDILEEEFPAVVLKYPWHRLLSQQMVSVCTIKKTDK